MRATATAHTEGIVIDVSVDQDGEGTFGVIWGEEGWDPPVPTRPREWSRAELEEVIVSVVAEWIGALVPPKASELHWEVTTPDGTVDAVPWK